MKKNTKILLFVFITGALAACTVNPAQMFIASGVNGNGCCDSKTVVVVTKDANGQTTIVEIPSSTSASPTVKPSASASPSASISPSPSATASPVPSSSPTSAATASPTATPSAAG